MYGYQTYNSSVNWGPVVASYTHLKLILRIYLYSGLSRLLASQLDNFTLYK